MSEHMMPIPSRIYNAAVGGHICGTEDIIDDDKNKTQKQINSEVEESLGTGGSVDSRIASAVATETLRAQTAEADRYTKSETYTKEEVHNLITTPGQEYVTVTATDQTTAVTDVLPATGAADTTYRVGNWDGTQYNDSVFSEYAWNGSAYIKLSTKSQVGEVYDISVNHADTKYADLAAALGTNGANIPQSLRKGGMSVKFVLSSDNKYVQYRLMADGWSTTESDWQGVDEEPTAGSENLVKSGGVADNFSKTNQIEFVCQTSSSTYIDFDYKLFAGRRYRIVNNSGTPVQFYLEDLTTQVLYVPNNSDTIVIFPNNAVGPRKTFGGGIVTITPLDDVLSPEVLHTPIRHFENKLGFNSFVREIYIKDGMCTTASLQLLNDYLYLYMDSVSKGTFPLSSIESNKVQMLIDGVYIIIDKNYKPLDADDSITNFALEYNPMIASYLQSLHGDYVEKKFGVNLINNVEFGKFLYSDGGIGENSSITDIGITNKLYFGDAQKITCNNCMSNIGYGCATYDASGNVVSSMALTQPVTTLEKTGNAVYAIFTVTTRNYITDGQLLQAQYGKNVTEYEKYSPIGGYLEQKVFYCGPSYELSTLRAGIEAAEQVMDAILYVEDGTYDLIQEFGSAYFENIPADNALAGIVLKNRIHIIFSPNSKVVSHYTGNNAYAQTNYSPFNAGKYGFTLENLNLECSRCRYAVHDERHSEKEIYKSEYINCNFSFDNSDNEAWEFGETIIGTGTGCNAEIIVKNCTFDSVNNGCWYYAHGPGNNDFKFTINLINNYVSRGIVIFQLDTENSDNPSVINILGNSVPYDVRNNIGGVCQKQGSTTYNIIHSWNNEIRNQNNN